MSGSQLPSARSPCQDNMCGAEDWSIGTQYLPTRGPVPFCAIRQATLRRGIHIGNAGPNHHLELIQHINNASRIVVMVSTKIAGRGC